MYIRPFDTRVAGSVLLRPQGAVRSFAFSPCHRFLACGNVLGEVVVHEYPSWAMLQGLRPWEKPPYRDSESFWGPGFGNVF